MLTPALFVAITLVAAFMLYRHFLLFDVRAWKGVAVWHIEYRAKGTIFYHPIPYYTHERLGGYTDDEGVVRRSLQLLRENPDLVLNHVEGREIR